MSEESKESSAPKQVEQELSGLEPQELLYALGVDFDIDAQVAAIHARLRRNRAGAAEIAEEIKSAEDRARHLKGVLNDWAVDDWVDRVHYSAYQEAALDLDFSIALAWHRPAQLNGAGGQRIV